MIQSHSSTLRVHVSRQTYFGYSLKREGVQQQSNNSHIDHTVKVEKSRLSSSEIKRFTQQPITSGGSSSAGGVSLFVTAVTATSRRRLSTEITVMQHLSPANPSSRKNLYLHLRKFGSVMTSVMHDIRFRYYDDQGSKGFVRLPGCSDCRAARRPAIGGCSRRSCITFMAAARAMNTFF